MSWHVSLLMYRYSICTTVDELALGDQTWAWAGIFATTPWGWYTNHSENVRTIHHLPHHLQYQRPEDRELSLMSNKHFSFVKQAAAVRIANQNITNLFYCDHAHRFQVFLPSIYLRRHPDLPFRPLSAGDGRSYRVNETSPPINAHKAQTLTALQRLRSRGKECKHKGVSGSSHVSIYGQPDSLACPACTPEVLTKQRHPTPSPYLSCPRGSVFGN